MERKSCSKARTHMYAFVTAEEPKLLTVGRQKITPSKKSNESLDFHLENKRYILHVFAIQQPNSISI